MSSQAELQRLLVEYEYLRRLLEAIQGQLELLNATRARLLRSREALEEIKKQKPGDALLAPLGVGVFLHARLERVDRVVVDIGSGYYLEKSPDEAIKYLDERIAEIDEAMRRLQLEAGNVAKRLNEILPVLRSRLQEARS